MAKEPKQDSDQSQPRRDGMAVRVRQARERKGLSLADLHKATGLSRSALHDYESGRTKPGSRELLLICECLEVTPNWLLCGTEEPLKRRDGLKKLVRLKSSPMLPAIGMFIFPIVLSALDDEEVEALLTLIASMLQAKDQKTYKQMSAAVEVLMDSLGDGSPAGMGELSQRANDPEFIKGVQERIAAKLKESG